MWSTQPCTESSKSYTSNSSSSCILQPIMRRSGRTMDEVWNSITALDHNQRHNYTQKHMGGTCHQSSSSSSSSSSIRGTILQDFLAVPLLKETSTDHPVLLSYSPVLNSRGKVQLSPATALSLHSAGFDVFRANKYQTNKNHDENHRHQNPTHLSHSPFMPTTPTPLVDASGMISFCGSKRLLEQVPSGGACDGVNRRHKRMIKNRESAARSRARKQAYTNELEVEVTHLIEENNRLRKERDEMKMILAADNPTRKKLIRTSTAPF